MKDLALLHDKHMNRPTLDDSSEEEHAIEITTQEITQVKWMVCIYSLILSAPHFFLCGQSSQHDIVQLTNSVFVADVSSMPASRDGFAVSLWPLHRAGGEAAEKRGVVPGTEPAGAVHQFQTHTVWLPKT